DFHTGEKAGSHAKEKGPVWVAKDGSKLTARKIVANDPAPHSTAVEWLHVTCENGGGFGKVTHIQRVDTWAGQPPSERPTKAGETKQVRYHATYVFWGER